MKLSNRRVITSNLGNYHRVMETTDNIYFACFEESDETASIKMYDRKMNLVSSNYFAYQSFTDDFGQGNYTWLSEKMKKHLDVSI